MEKRCVRTNYNVFRQDPNGRMNQNVRYCGCCGEQLDRHFLIVSYGSGDYVEVCSRECSIKLCDYCHVKKALYNTGVYPDGYRYIVCSEECNEKLFALA